jgi:1-acyl-sn-glycerol-3-phosphate acyltransferase
MIWSLIFITNMIVLGIPSAFLFIPWRWMTGNVLPLYKATRFMLFSSCRLAGVRIRSQGLNLVPRDRACIFMSNHVSNLDPPALISLIPGRTSAFMKRSLMELPILGTGFRQGEFIAVDRSGSRTDAQRSVAEAQQVLAKGVHITTFVEGTRSPDGRMLPFKKGPFFLAVASGAPCVPVSIHGSEAILRKGSLRIHPGDAHVIFHSPIDPAAFSTREDLMHAVRTAIESGLPEWMRNERAASEALNMTSPSSQQAEN